MHKSANCLAATASFAMLMAFGVSAAPFPAQPFAYNFGISPQTSVSPGWQSPTVVTIQKTAAPEGQINYSCPSKYPVAISGSETFDSAGQKDTILVVSDGLELKKSKTETGTWSFYFRWPNGIKSTENLTVDVYCAAK